MKKGFVNFFLLLTTQSCRLPKPSTRRFVVIHHQQVMLRELKRHLGIATSNAFVKS